MARTSAILMSKRGSRSEGKSLWVKEPDVAAQGSLCRWTSEGLRRASRFPATATNCPSFLRGVIPLPNRQDSCRCRTLGNDHVALPGGLVRKAQLPPYLVRSDKEQNLSERRREPQLAKPRDAPPPPCTHLWGFSSALAPLWLIGPVTGLMRRAQLGGGRNGHLDRGHGDKHKPWLLGLCWNPWTPTKTRQNALHFSCSQVAA